MIAIFSLFVVLTLSLVTNRIATIILTHTGLSWHVARFQARSALTGVGFTTAESENVVGHPVRRRVVMALMLVGNAGVITAVSSLIIAFVDVPQGASTLYRLLLLCTGLAALVAASRSAWLDKHLRKLIVWALNRFTSLEIKDYSGLLHLAGEYTIAEYPVRGDGWLANRSLAELRLPEEGIMVLGVARQSGEFIGVPEGDTVLLSGETLVVYGRVSAFERLQGRSRDLGGEWDRREAVVEQRRVARAEKGREEAATEKEE